ncbi:unnamed protein product [Arctia plantaginis]|uniref:Uncharacterized protein n=1 Tax=Arctia plantaginis TaxID=874455 RepID=A0A8S1B469_ARCPL|nr:unnamed protein product [Arctia plantaginis]
MDYGNVLRVKLAVELGVDALETDALEEEILGVGVKMAGGGETVDSSENCKSESCAAESSSFVSPKFVTVDLNRQPKILHHIFFKVFI